MGYTFDGPSKIISLTSGTTGFDVIDLYSRWKDWMLLSDNAKYLPALRAVGGDPISATKNLGSTFFMCNGWRIRPDEVDHRLEVNGNLFTDPSGDSPFVSTLGDFNIVIEMSVSSLVDSTVAQLSEIQYSLYENRVCINAVSGTAGTEYPIGTFQYPVSNLQDALAIASNRGFRTLQLLSPLTITTGQDISGLLIKSDNWLDLTIQSGVISDDAEFERVSLYGELSGTWNVCTNCWVYEVTNFAGWLVGGSFVQINLAPYCEASLGQSYIDNTTPMYPHEYSTVVMNTNTSLAATGISGDYAIKSITEGSIAVLAFSGGKLYLDGTCTGGKVYARSNVELEDESNGTDVDNDTTSAMTWMEPVEGTYTAGEILRIMSAVLAGKVSGAQNSMPVFRDLSDTRNRVSATTDGTGNRTTITLDAG